jgi:3-deoxy-D-manno-octulosonate cytidylyltransferase
LVRATVCIPARLGSTRLAQKALADIAGLPMIARVVQRASRASCVDRLIVATDHPAIAEAVAGSGAEVHLTSPHHPSGTDRILELLGRGLLGPHIINVQGDEPLVDPEHIDRLAEATGSNPVATLAAPLQGDAEAPDRVKVVCDPAGRALYFSRAPIPYGGPYLQHIGLYGFQAEALRRFGQSPPGFLERRERLEQLRFLDMGLPIQVVEVERASQAVDTAEDLERVRAVWAALG